MANFQFLRVVPVNLMRYLPQFLAQDERFKTIQDTLSVEHEKQRQLAIDLEKQFFVDTATWGLDDWERFAGIEVNRSLDYESRRKKIKLHLYPEISSSEKYLENLANQYLLDASADIVPHNEEYWFELTFNIDGLISLTDLKYAINLYKPAHLGFLIAFKIYSEVNTAHKAEITQYIDALHNNWNLGTAETTHWDGAYAFDGTIDFSSIKPDSLYKECQSHISDITGSVTPLYRQEIIQLVQPRAIVINSSKQLSQHKVNSSAITDGSYRQRIDIANINTIKADNVQSRAGLTRNILDGSFIMDGSHCFDGSYADTALYENRCAVATLDAQGNVKEGSWQTA